MTAAEPRELRCAASLPIPTRDLPVGDPHVAANVAHGLGHGLTGAAVAALNGAQAGVPLAQSTALPVVPSAA